METSIVLLVAYFLLLLVIGMFASRNETKDGYLLADRKLGAFSSSFSIVASKIGGGMILVLTAFVYIYGLSAILYVVGAAIGYIIFLVLATRIKGTADRKQFYTLMDYIVFRFGKQHAKWLAALLFFANVTNYFIQVIAGGKIVSFVFGIPFFWSVLIVITAILIYLLLGGFKAVVYTDILQGIMFIVFLGVILAFFATTNIATPDFETMSLPLSLGFVLLGVFLPFSSHELWQRVYATKRHHLKRSLVIAMILYLFVGSLLILLGYYIKATYSGLDPDISLLHAFAQQSGFLKSLGVLSLFAVIMSSADTWLFNVTGIYFHDLQGLRHYKKQFMTGFAVFSALALLSSMFFQSLVDYTVIYTFIYLTIGSLIMFGMFFRLRNLATTYIFISILTIIIIIISRLRVEYAVAGILVLPVALACNYIYCFVKRSLH